MNPFLLAAITGVMNTPGGPPGYMLDGNDRSQHPYKKPETPDWVIEERKRKAQAKRDRKAARKTK